MTAPASEWVPNKGRARRTKRPETMVDLRLRCGWEVGHRRAGNYRWDHLDEPGDILFARKSTGDASPRENWR